MEDHAADKDGVGMEGTMQKSSGHNLANTLDTIGWALFFIWVGVALLVDFGIGIGLIGVGVITLGMQAVRGAAKLKLEGFWVVIGVLMLLGGIWDILKPSVPLLPILLLVAGLLLLLSIARRGRNCC